MWDFMDKIELKTPPVENQTGRLDKFLVSCFPEFSRNQFIHLIEAKAVCVKDHPERLLQADSKILKGDVFESFHIGGHSAGEGKFEDCLVLPVGRVFYFKGKLDPVTLL